MEIEIIDTDYYFEDMAISRSDAMDKGQEWGPLFIQHFEKIYDEPDSNAVNSWIKEMANKWYNKIRSYKLKETNRPILFGDLRDWFFTACALPKDFMKNPTNEKLEAYDKFVNYLSVGQEVRQALISAGVIHG